MNIRALFLTHWTKEPMGQKLSSLWCIGTVWSIIQLLLMFNKGKVKYDTNSYEQDSYTFLEMFRLTKVTWIFSHQPPHCLTGNTQDLHKPWKMTGWWKKRIISQNKYSANPFVRWSPDGAHVALLLLMSSTLHCAQILMPCDPSRNPTLSLLSWVRWGRDAKELL